MGEGVWMHVARMSFLRAIFCDITSRANTSEVESPKERTICHVKVTLLERDPL